MKRSRSIFNFGWNILGGNDLKESFDFLKFKNMFVFGEEMLGFLMEIIM